MPKTTQPWPSYNRFALSLFWPRNLAELVRQAIQNKRSQAAASACNEGNPFDHSTTGLRWPLDTTAAK